MSTAVRTSSPWLQGPASDLLFGAGLLYVPILAVAIVAGADLRIAGFSLLPLFVVFIANTHLGATLLRVYERPEDRRAYRIFAVWLTAVLAAVAVAALWYTWIGSALLTLYLTVVPWHFTGQNYGVSLVFLRRRQVPIDPTLKRAVWLTFTLPFLMWIVSLHAARPGADDYALLRSSGTVYSFVPAGFPELLLPWTLGIAGTVWIGAVLYAGRRLLQHAGPRELVPAAGTALTQALWFAASVLGMQFLRPESLGSLAELWSTERAGALFVWIQVVHSVQYLWITRYFVQKERPGATATGFLGKSLLASMAIFGVPLLILAPNALGTLSYDAGLYLMLAAGLQLHHVMLDSVIWKLRNSRVAGILIGGDTGGALASTGRAWVRPLVYASGVLGLVLMMGYWVEDQWVFRRAVAEHDATRLEASVERLTWMGRDTAVGRAILGSLKYREGDLEGAQRELQRSVELKPSVSAWVKLAQLHEQRGEPERALAAYEAALALAPERMGLLQPALRLARLVGDQELARSLVLRAAEASEGEPQAGRTSARALEPNDERPDG